MPEAAPFYPPRPSRLPAVAALVRTVWQGEGDLLSLLPAYAYTRPVATLGYSRRSIRLFNDPELVREILLDREGCFPKSDLMVNALEPLIGESIFVTDGEKWRRQRAMIDPAFSHMRLNLAFDPMQAAVKEHLASLTERARSGDPFSLDLAMSHLTADIICRTVFSVSLDSSVAQDVFDDFVQFERDVAQVRIWRLIVDPAWTRVPQKPSVQAACDRIRRHLGDLIDTHLNDDTGQFDDIASAVISARDTETGKPFTRDELIDQLGVFFLAGHETTASALTWVFYVLAMRADILERVRREVYDVAGDAPIGLAHIRDLRLVRSVFREALRLYPPITFMPRVAERTVRIGGHKVKRGALVMIAPWTLHRNRENWQDADRFDPDRFMPDRERDIRPGTYIPFGAGPHTCVGAGFAAQESALIIATLARAFDFEVLNPDTIRPAARLTTRPAREIKCRITPHKP